jgi:hypothetical protein
MVAVLMISFSLGRPCIQGAALSLGSGMEAGSWRLDEFDAVALELGEKSPADIIRSGNKFAGSPLRYRLMHRERKIQVKSGDLELHLRASMLGARPGREPSTRGGLESARLYGVASPSLRIGTWSTLPRGRGIAVLRPLPLRRPRTRPRKSHFTPIWVWSSPYFARTNVRVSVPCVPLSRVIGAGQQPVTGSYGRRPNASPKPGTRSCSVAMSGAAGFSVVAFATAAGGAAGFSGAASVGS